MARKITDFISSRRSKKDEEEKPEEETRLERFSRLGLKSSSAASKITSLEEKADRFKRIGLKTSSRKPSGISEGFKVTEIDRAILGIRPLKSEIKKATRKELDVKIESLVKGDDRIGDRAGLIKEEKPSALKTALSVGLTEPTLTIVPSKAVKERFKHGTKAVLEENEKIINRFNRLKDDFEIEEGKVFGTIKEGFSEQKLGIIKAQTYSRMAEARTPDSKKIYQKTIDEIEKFTSENAVAIRARKETGKFTQAVRGVSGQAALYANNADAKLAGLVIGGVLGGKTGAEAGLTLAMGVDMYDIEFGGAYEEMIKSNIPEDKAKEFSTYAGAINAGLESGELLLNMWTWGAGNLFKKPAKAAAEKASKSLATKLGKFAGRYITGVTGETLQEGIQGGVTATMTMWAMNQAIEEGRMTVEDADRIDFEDIGDRVVDEMKASLPTMMLMGALGGGSHFITEYIGDKQMNQAQIDIRLEEIQKGFNAMPKDQQVGAAEAAQDDLIFIKDKLENEPEVFQNEEFKQRTVDELEAYAVTVSENPEIFTEATKNDVGIKGNTLLLVEEIKRLSDEVEAIPNTTVKLEGETIANRIIKDNGITIDNDNNMPNSGYAVAVSGFEKIVDKDKFTQADIDAFKAENQNILSREGNHLGAWVDEGKVYLDVSTIYHNRETAEQTAKLRGEKALFNLKTFEEIETGLSDKEATAIKASFKAVKSEEAKKIAQRRFFEEKEERVTPDLAPEFVRITEDEVKRKAGRITPAVKEKPVQPKIKPDFIVGEKGVAINRRAKKYNNLLADAKKKGLTKAQLSSIDKLIEIKESLPEMKKLQKELLQEVKKVDKERYDKLRAKIAEKEAIRKEKQEFKKIKQAKRKTIEKIKGKMSKIKTMRPEEKELAEKLMADFDVTKLSPSKASALTDLKNALSRFDITIGEKAKADLTRLSKTPLADMKLEEVDFIFDMLNALVTASSNQNKLIRKGRKESATIAALESKQHVEESNAVWIYNKSATEKSVVSGVKVDKISVKDAVGKLSTKAETAPTLTGRLGDTAREILYDEIEEGRRVQKEIIHTVEDTFLEFNKENKVRDWIRPTKAVQIKLPSGATLEMTKSQRIAFYLSSKDRGVLESLVEKGFTFDRDSSDYTQITIEDLKAIEDSMTPAEKQWADTYYDMQKMFMKLGNKVFVELKGYEVLKNEHYFTKRASDLSLDTEVRERKGEKRPVIENNPNFTERTGAINPVVMVGAIESLKHQTSLMSALIGMAIPVRNAKMFLNESITKNNVVNNFSRDYYNTLQKRMDDIENKAVDKDMVGNFGMNLLRHTQAAVIGVNLKIALKQPASVFAAMSEMDAKYLSKSINVWANRSKQKALRKEMMENSPFLRDRLSGESLREISAIHNLSETQFFITGQTRNMSSAFRAAHDAGFIKGFGEITKGFEKQGTRLLAWGDTKAMYVIYDAVKSETADKIASGELKFKTEQGKNEHVAKRAEHVVAYTQPISGTENLSELSRSTNFLSRSLTQFTNQAFQNLNIIKRASWEYKESNRTLNDKKNLIKKTFPVVIYQSAMLALINKVWDKWRGKESEDDENEIMEFLKDMVLTNLGAIPFFTTARYALERKGSPQSTMTSAVADLGEFIGDVTEIVVDSEKKFTDDLDGLVKDFALATTPFLGIPYRNSNNLQRDIARRVAPELVHKLNIMLGNVPKKEKYDRLFNMIADKEPKASIDEAVRELLIKEDEDDVLTWNQVVSAIDRRNIDSKIKIGREEAFKFMEDMFEFTIVNPNKPPERGKKPASYKSPYLAYIDENGEPHRVPKYIFEEDEIRAAKKAGMSRFKYVWAVEIENSVTTKEKKVDRLLEANYSKKEIEIVLGINRDYKFDAEYWRNRWKKK